MIVIVYILNGKKNNILVEDIPRGLCTRWQLVLGTGGEFCVLACNWVGEI